MNLEQAPGPLAGVRVLDLTRNAAGMYCTMILGDLGAEVIKVEPRQPNPEALGSRTALGHSVDGVQMRFVHPNRNKKSIMLEVREPAGREVFYELVRQSDVVIDNYRPGVMEARGLDYDRLKEINPRIICCSITGFGRSGPYARRPSFDPVAQAYSGMLSLTGEEGGPPLYPGVPIADFGTGMYCAHGIMAALYARHQNGTGQRVEVSLLDTCLAFTSYDAAHYLNTGQVSTPAGRSHRTVPISGIYRAADGYMVVAPLAEKHVKSLFQCLGLESLLSDPRFDTGEKRTERREEVNRLVGERLATRTTAEWVNLLAEADVPAAPVNTLDQTFADPHVRTSEIVGALEYRGRGFRVVGNPIKMSSMAGQRLDPPPELGEHTEEALRELLGYSGERLEELRSQGLI